MAWVFAVQVRMGGYCRWRRDQETGRSEARARHIYEMEEDQRDRFGSRVEGVTRTRGKVQRGSERFRRRH